MGVLHGDGGIAQAVPAGQMHPSSPDLASRVHVDAENVDEHGRGKHAVLDVGRGLDVYVEYVDAGLHDVEGGGGGLSVGRHDGVIGQDRGVGHEGQG